MRDLHDLVKVLAEFHSARSPEQGSTDNGGKASCQALSCFVIRISSFLIDIPQVAFITLEFLDVFVGLLLGFASLFLSDFAHRSIDIFGHAPGIAADVEMRALALDP